MTSVTEVFGKYQLIQYILTCIPHVFFAVSNINYVFVAGDLNYRCRVDECEENIPEYTALWWPATSTDRCLKPISNRTIPLPYCTNASFTNSHELCTEWIYESRDTIIAELDLACQPIKTGMIGVVHNIATAISMLAAGWIADQIGRKKALTICSTCIIFGTFKTLTSSYSFYLLMELLEAITNGGVVTSGLVLMIEIGGKSKRVLSGVLFACSCYIGEILYALTAMFVPNWKTLILITYSPSILFLSYFFMLKETLRWLIVNEKIDDAKETVKSIIKMNKLEMNINVVDKMDLKSLKELIDVESYEQKEGLGKAFNSREIMKRFLVASCCRFTVCFVYYGLTVNSVMLPGNKYVNFLLTSLMSFPGDILCLILMNRFGRKMPLIFSFALCAVACLCFGFIPSYNSWLKLTFFLLSKILITICYTGLVIYVMELFPTSVRGSMLGLSVVLGSVGTILAPLTPALATVYPVLPAVCFATSSFISSILLLLTPETANRRLLDTIEQLDSSVTPTNKTSVGTVNTAFILS
ncbi:organic cation transporter protein-like isoform X2 [Leptidea sinapis]|uniref:organic cation transporter protein-like isoform X2 n=1 Tax=Leptidea sinapis TaxID=189913 RepID=UPI0021C40E64|nr:organic cation transporter protein-like isoform X2 [Leptidea sinapis]